MITSLIIREMKIMRLLLLLLTTMRLSPHINQNGDHQKNPQTINVGEDVEKKKSSYIVAGTVNLYSHYGKQYGDLKKKTKNKTRTKSTTQNNGRKQRETEEHLDEGERGE